MKAITDREMAGLRAKGCIGLCCVCGMPLYKGEPLATHVRANHADHHGVSHGEHALAAAVTMAEATLVEAA